MPTYDYVCSACGHRFEEFQSMTSKPLRSCPECKKPALERLIGAGAGVIFKGSGFYQTDYKGSGKPGKSGKPGASDAPRESAKSDDAKQDGGCSPACGTDQAPAGCRKNGDKPKQS
jgi:putative FmdB family regulatory protein